MQGIYVHIQGIKKYSRKLLNISREGEIFVKTGFFLLLLLVFSAQKFQIRAENYKFVLLLHGITNDSKTEA